MFEKSPHTRESVSIDLELTCRFTPCRPTRANPRLGSAVQRQSRAASHPDGPPDPGRRAHHPGTVTQTQRRPRRRGLAMEVTPFLTEVIDPSANLSTRCSAPLIKGSVLSKSRRNLPPNRSFVLVLRPNSLGSTCIRLSLSSGAPVVTGFPPSCKHDK